VYYLFRVTRTG